MILKMFQSCYVKCFSVDVNLTEGIVGWNIFPLDHFSTKVKGIATFVVGAWHVLYSELPINKYFVRTASISWILGKYEIGSIQKQGTVYLTSLHSLSSGSVISSFWVNDRDHNLRQEIFE